MLQIFAGNPADQVSLIDLDKETEFDIEIEQPMLSEDGMPVPFSTSIDIPVTTNNRAIFGYLPFLALEPDNKELHARICVDGITLAIGMLTFDGIRDGRLQYTFSGHDLSTSEAWRRKIWDITPEHEERLIDENYMELPIMLNASKTGMLWAPGGVEASEDPSEKYRNYGLWFSGTRVTSTPVIRVSAIALMALQNITMGSRMQSFLDMLGVMGNYGETRVHQEYDPDPSEWFKQLPDLTVAELVKEVLNLKAAFIFSDGSTYRILSAEDIMYGGPVVDWSDRVSDVFSLTKVESQTLKMGYTSIKEAEDIDTSEAQTKSSFKAIINAAANDFSGEGYKNYIHSAIGDVYSMKKSYDLQEEIGDIVLQDLGRPDDSDNGAAFDLRTSLIPVKCFPERLYTASGTTIDRLLPVVSVAAATDERGKTTYIGILGEYQMCDKGRVVGVSGESSDVNLGESLDIASLYVEVQDFGRWLASQRRRVEADLNLSLKDIADLRMWKKFYFMGATWIAEKFTIHLSADGHRPTVTGSFISCPL